MFCGFSTFYVTCAISKVLICFGFTECKYIQFSSVQFSSVQFSSVQFISFQFNSIQFNSGPFLFEVNNQDVAVECHCYFNTLWRFLGMELWRMRQRVTNVCFQQDGARVHTTNQQNDFALMIWHVCWPTRSLDLKVTDILLWKCQKTEHVQLTTYTTKNWKSALQGKIEQIMMLYCSELCRILYQYGNVWNVIGVNWNM